MLGKLWRLCGEETRRAFGAIVAMYRHVREMDEQALRSLGVILRGPRD